MADGAKAGYGSVWGSELRQDRDAIFEFYLTKHFEKLADVFFEALSSAFGATLVECQSNESLLSTMLYQFTENINAEAILFADDFQSKLAMADAVFGREDFENENKSDVGGYFLKQNGEVVATGGFMLNYNKPYADIYMDVKEPCRQKGFGSLMVQKLKREIYLTDRVPSARCNVNKKASKATLLKAGFKVCGALLKGNIKGM